MSRTVSRVLFALVIVLFSFSASKPSVAAPARADQLPVLPAQADGRSEDPAWRTWEGLDFASKAKVDPRILAELRGEIVPAHISARLEAAVGPFEPQPLTKTRFLVYLHQQADLAALDQMVLASQTQRRTAMYDLLSSSAEQTQAGVRAALNTRMATDSVKSYQPFFIVNVLAVEGDLATILELAQRPDVARIAANYPLVALGMQNAQYEVRSAESVIRNSQFEQAEVTQLDPDNWNIELVGADRVWRELGVRGEGAVVAGFDTGVSWQHPALADKYRGNLRNGRFDHNYNWFEPSPTLYPDGNFGESLSRQPYDCDGHGTHTMGTMVGEGRTSGSQIGMAPGARWIAMPGICYGTMPGGIRDDIGALKAFQWLLCPTNLSGDLATADCSKAPDVVNNSWGSANPVNDVLRPAIQRLRAAGIAPVFASGNPDAGPGSIGTPANAPEAIAVGATDRRDNIAYFSGRGPSFYEGEQKPELSAPGVEVISSIGSSDYYYGSGTSMAAPHVAGLVALIVSADLRDGIRDFSVDEIEQFMAYTALDLGEPGADGDFGYGRIRAYEAVQWALSAGDLQGTVRDAITNLPIAEAQMTGSNFGGSQFSAKANGNGVYSATVPAGAYQVAITAWGYTGVTFSNQQVFSSSLAVADFKLQPQPTAPLNGIVRSGETPVSDALVYVEAHPATQAQTDSEGRYALTLPVGTHTLVVKARGNRVLRTPVQLDASGLAADLSLQPAPSILLVEADTYNGWFFSWPMANIYRWALDKQNLQYDEWRVQYTYTDTRTLDDGSLGYGIPTTDTLKAYDLVIWSHNGCVSYYGCYYSETDRFLPGYLDNGGRLIISGQDLGRTDESTFYDEYLYADLAQDGGAREGETISGADFLQGVQVTLTNASLYSHRNGAISFSPDAVAPQPGDGAAYPVMTYDSQNGGGAALAIDPCAAPYRAVYLAMGYENIGPRAANRDPAIAEVLGRSIDWVMAPKTARGLSLMAMPDTTTTAPGQRTEYTVRVVNGSTEAAAVQLAFNGNQWPTRVLSGTVELTEPLQLDPCRAVELTVEVAIPAMTANDTSDQVVMTAAYVDRPDSAQQVALSTTAFVEWHAEQPMAWPRYRLGAVTLPEDVHFYALGGWMYNAFQFIPFASTANERYNACTQRWEAAYPMPLSVANAGVGALDGKIYVIGGQDLSILTFGLVTYDAVNVYDPATDSWAPVAKLPTPLAGLTVAAANGKLYAFGGEDSNGTLSDQTLEYDPASNSWRQRAPMPGGGRIYPAAATLGGKIYVVGGWPELATVEVYDPAADTWTTAASLNQGRHSPGIAAAPDGYLYVSGGGASQEGLGSAERYNPQADTWQTITSLNDDKRWGSTSVYVAGRIYAIGGAESRRLEALAVASSVCLSNKTTANPALVPGTPLTYTLEVAPNATDLADVQVIDRIPEKLRFTGFTANPIGATYNEALRQVEWRGTLAANATSAEVSYGVELATDNWHSGEVISSTAVFSTSTGIVFSRTVTNTLFTADFSASSVFVDHEVARSGDPMTYTISLRGRTIAGGPLTVQNPLPPEVDYVADSLVYSRGAGHYEPDTRTIVWEGIIPSGQYFGGGEFNYVWGDSDGQGVLENVRFHWKEISSTGTLIPGFDEAYVCEVPIGFAFSFYGQSYSTLCVSTNGFISFDMTGTSDFTNDCPLPSDNGNDAMIAAIWDDLVVMDGVTYESFGSAPDRYLVIQWAGVRRYGQPSTRYADFQLILHENGQFDIQVRDAGVLTGGSSTTGVENQPGTVGVTYACDQLRTLHDNLAIRFAPNTGVHTSTEITYRVVSAGDLDINRTVTNTAVISTPQGLIERSVATLFNPVNLNSSTLVLSRSEINPNETLTYTFVLRNTGLVSAYPTLTMRPPSATAYVTGSLICASGLCSYGDGLVQWYGEIAPSQEVTVSFALRLITPLPDRTPVTGQIELDDGYGNRYEVPISFLARRANLSGSLAQMTPPFIDPGESALVTLFARNIGTLQTTAQLQMTLPAGLVYEEGTLACTVGECKIDRDVVHWTGIVPARSVVQVQFRVVAPLTARYGDLFTGNLTVDDLDWNEHYAASMRLSIERGTYLPRITTVPGPATVYMPFVMRSEQEAPAPLLIIAEAQRVKQR